MEKLASSLLLRDFIDVLTTDIGTVGSGHIFTCRPLKGATSEQDMVLGRFRGEIKLADCLEFQNSLEEMMTDRLLKIVLDFKNVILCPTAIGNLVNFAAAMYGRNKRLYLYRVSDQIRASLKDMQLSGFFTFLETEDDILAALIV